MVNILGLYSVEMEEKTHRESEQHYPHREGGSLATALKTDNHTKS